MVDTVTMVSDPGAEAPKGHDAAMAAKFEGTPDPAPAPAEGEGEGGYVRPEQFKSEEDLYNAYNALRTKMSQGKPAEPAPEPDDEPPADDALQGAVDLNAFTAEYMENGELSADSYAALEAAGFSAELVDNYIAGQMAIGEQMTNAVYEAAGGKDAYDAMVDWAADVYSDAEISAFDQAIIGDAATRDMALANLKARYTAENGSAPNLVNGDVVQGGGEGYESWAQVTTDMKDPRYVSDPAFRNQVEKKLSRSKL